MDADRSPAPPSESDVLARLRAAMAAGEAPSHTLGADVEDLFAQEQRRIQALCTRMCGDQQIGLELAQEAMLVAFRRLPEFEQRSSFGTWLYGIARHLCLNRIRLRSELLSDDGIVDPGDPQLSVLSCLTRHEREQLITDAVATLPSVEQEAVWLRYVESLPRERIEALLGLEPGQARVILQRTSRHLRREVAARLQALGQGSSFLRSSGE